MGVMTAAITIPPKLKYTISSYYMLPKHFLSIRILYNKMHMLGHGTKQLWESNFAMAEVFIIFLRKTATRFSEKKHSSPCFYDFVLEHWHVRVLSLKRERHFVNEQIIRHVGYAPTKRRIGWKMPVFGRVL